MSLKDQELQAYYEALFMMYTTPGWQELMADVGRMLRVADTPRDVKTVEELHHRRGELAQMDWLATHQQRTEAAYALLLTEDGQSGEDIETGGQARIVEGEGE